MSNLMNFKNLSNRDQYLILEWLDVAITRTERHEIVLETESLSLK
ncbi:hypothetical protein [[Acholeplasma] multilocale]|nr:hypothetical protein [[Acholeplasma] multilocale]